MGTVWARRREDVLRDCLVSPDVFIPMVDRLAEFVVPYQHVLETEAGQRNVHLYLQGLLSHLPGKNAEDIATFVDVERQVMQAFIGTAPWDHRPLIEVLVAQVGPPGANARKFTVSLSQGFPTPVRLPRVVAEMRHAGLPPAQPVPVAQNTFR